MGLGIIEKILRKHIVEGEPSPGAEVAVRIDQTLTQDATGTMAYLQFEALGVPRVKTELSVSYVDHNTIQMGPENAGDHAYLESVAAKYGIVFSRAGNGICHQVHFERFAAPGKTLLGSDSHTPTAGGLGMFAVGAGGLDVAAAMTGHPFYIKYPRVLNVKLTGKLSPGVAAKDVVLHLLGILTTKGNVGCAIEYSGDGVAALTAEDRATITNMGAETGVTTSVFPSDGETKRFLEAQGRGDAWRELAADDDAAYDRVIGIDLASVVPMVATPHSPGNIATVEETKGLKVSQVIIGSCTNSSVRDLNAAAAILKGRKIPPGMSLIVVPGSRQALRMILASGVYDTFVDAGARVLEPTCGFCIGSGASPASGTVSVRTNNRNFEGRCGTSDAGVYLVSSETAAATAVAGALADPRGVDGIAATPATEEFLLDDSMFILPPEDGSGLEVVRPPHMGELTPGRKLEETIAACVTGRFGDKITTDHIAPGGARLKLRSNIAAYAEFVFEKADPDFVSRAKACVEGGRKNVIVAGVSYGQGSSREHAALCPAYLGVCAVIAKSFERIHSANLVNFGIMPLTFGNEGDYDGLDAGTEVEFVDVVASLRSGGDIRARVAGGGELSLSYDLSARQREILIAGGMLSYLREKSSI